MSSLPPAQKPSAFPMRLIEPAQTWSLINLRELWQYRDLIYFMTLRDIKVRYKQTILGPFWPVVQPFVLMIVFSFVFGGLAQFDSEGHPYPIFSYAALVPWTFFATAMTRITLSLVQNAGVITKIYFPRLILPIVGTFASLFDFIVSFALLLIMMLAFGLVPTANILWLPLLLLLAMVTSLGFGLWFAALNVRFRDIGYGVEFMLRVWIYLTPVAYSSEILPEPWSELYLLNPMSGVVEGFRWALLGSQTPPGAAVLVAALASVFILVTGLVYFNRTEAIFADVV